MNDPMDWPFDEPKNVAVITSRRILEHGAFIHYVSHDEDDGGWQFHPVGFTPMEEAMVVSLEGIFRHDPTIGVLADLPLGWCATRASQDAPWQRRRNRSS